MLIADATLISPLVVKPRFGVDGYRIDARYRDRYLPGGIPGVFTYSKASEATLAILADSYSFIARQLGQPLDGDEFWPWGYHAGAFGIAVCYAGRPVSWLPNTPKVHEVAPLARLLAAMHTLVEQVNNQPEEYPN